MERIAILTGGDSAEYNISLLSANTVLKHLDRTKYEPIIVHYKNKKYTIENIELDLSNFTYNKENKQIHFDKIFIALHGPPAENGMIQNDFDKINIPYTSCNAKVSKLTFDKFACNNQLRKHGFNCAKSLLITSTEKISESKIINEIGLPCFVKPNRAGSSYGISKITEKKNLIKAINNALNHDKQVIIESFINGIEVSCGVYSNKNNIKALPITEIISENDFFDYSAKYQGKSQEITPARISDDLTLEIQKQTIDIYKKMKLSGVCRIDFIIQNKEAYIIEINTIPGLSEESIIPKQLKAENISLEDFFDLCLSNIN